jgi:hypothetical protein
MGNKIKAKEISQESLFRLLKDSTEKNSSIHFGFIVGAGASVKSGIPSGLSLAKKWYGEIKEDLNKKNGFEDWNKDINTENLAESYTKIFAKRFEIDYRAGYEELQRYMDKAEPSIGYSFLAQLLSKTSHKFIITTNFDTMVEDALFGLKEAKPLVLGHELLSKYINPTSPTRPTIIKIHRDFLLDPYNTDDDIKELDEQWKVSLEPLLKEHSMIVIGYGGNDDSLMNYLNEIKDRKPIYWCYRGDKSKLSSKITSILTEKDFIVQIHGFDKFMLLLNDKLNLGTIIDKEEINNSPIVKNALKYVDKYKKQLEELTRDELNIEEQKAVEKLLPSWYHYQLEVEKEKNDTKKEEIYLDGLKAYPQSYELMNNYAILLQKLKKDNEAELYFKNALDIAPNSPNNNCNYAQFLLIKGEKEQSKLYLFNAYGNNPKDCNMALELWFYRFAHFPEYFEEAKKELDLLLEKDIRSIGWDFSKNIEQAKKEGHKDIKLLEEYAKKITNP